MGKKNKSPGQKKAKSIRRAKKRLAEKIVSSKIEVVPKSLNVIFKRF